jgi:iron complex outermembrane recepter protein
MKKIALLCATTALVVPGAAFAQSTGTAEFENAETVVVTGTRNANVAGVVVPDTTKTRAELDSTFIQHQTAGQTINETINQLPGVSFTNNDPFGSAGGTLYIRGFDNSRISETFDGIPLNDTGNYALFSNQFLDPEIIDRVAVSLGSTDVDSPTASATGSTINFRTRLPFETFGARLQGSYGEFDGGNYFRVFGVVDTGEFGPWGTRAFAAASMATNDTVYGHRGIIYKQQYNARIYQPIGSNGDFISAAIHYNQNRNNFFGSLPLRTDLVNCRPVPTQTAAQAATCAQPRLVGSAAGNRYPTDRAERDYTVPRCLIQQNRVFETPAQVTAAGYVDPDGANTCGQEFEERYNPSNTGNVRFQSRFTLADNLILTVDPSFQWVKANGGGTVVAQEGLRDVNPAGPPGATNTATAQQCVQAPASAGRSCQIGYLAGIPFFGRDLNGDGDMLDTVRLVAPSQTATHRWGLNASLRYEINDDHIIRIAYAFDRGRHRQTGETGFLQANGEPFDVFPINDPVAAGNGDVLEKRDRLSIALLHQVSGEYRGEFFDGRLTVNAGVRAPFFTRDLTNYCATSSASGFFECFGTNTTGLASYLALNTVNIGGGVLAAPQGPQHRVLKYNAVLPNVGFIYDFMPRFSIYASYSRGLQVPSTDFLYNSFFYPAGTAQALPKPETTDNFDVGLRYRSSTLQAQVALWYTVFQNRLATAFDPDLDANVFRNLGAVHRYGIDADVDYRPIPELSIHAFGSYLWSSIQDDVLAGECSATVSSSCPAGSAGTAIFAHTAGRRESGAPVYTFGGRIQGHFGPIEIGVQAKRTGPRYVNDVNLPVVLCTNATGGGAFANVVDCPGATANPVTAASFQVFPARTRPFTTVDLDARVPLGFLGLNDDTYVQLNVTNLFDKFYVGNFTGALLNTSPTFVSVGAPRAVSVTLNVAYR